MKPARSAATLASAIAIWFVSTGHPAAKDPYFLYGASNLGSMLALLAYPLLIEPYTTINNEHIIVLTDLGQRLSQPWIWTLGYSLLLVMVLACAALVWAPSAIHIMVRPHAAVATMNFLVTPDGNGSRLSTETRVYANTDSARRRFAVYWRIIRPGSDIIRRMWLRAIKERAERSS